MYSQYFGLTQDPFSIAPDPRYLFMSERHREALAHLLYGVTGRNAAGGGTGGGFVLLTGDIGTGKTTICRCFLEQIPPGCHVAYIFNPKLTVTELLQSICEEFHITTAPAIPTQPTVKDYIDALNLFLLQSHAAGQSSVLIIDEAQNLKPDVLEQLRLLTNLETNERKLLQIVLIGQPELRSMLARPELEQLAQRVIARFHIDALTEAESTQYIQHRLAVAGLSGPLPFDTRSLRRIHRLARGVPRRINLLCGRALLGAWANGLVRVERKVVDRAAAEVFGADVASHAAPRSRLRSGWYSIAGLVLVAGTALAVYWPWANQPKAKPKPVSVALAPPPQPAASVPIKVELPVLRPIEEIEPLLPELARDANDAWRELAALWKLAPDAAEPCQAASAQQLQCYRSTKLSLPLLRQLSRPGILTLQLGTEPPRYAVLVGLTDQTATLRVAGKLHSVTQIALGALWRGDFFTYWSPPPGYQPDMPDGSKGAAVDKLANQLALLDGTAALAASGSQRLDAPLRARVRAFQRAQGLKPDGQPGPMTFMQIDSAISGNEPRLLTDLR